MNEDEMKQLKAYKVGYDLGWYRAMESVSNDLTEIADAIMHSSTFKAIEAEGKGQPIFLAKILDIISQIKEMRDENLPTLLVERQVISTLGAGLMEVLQNNPKALDATELGSQKQLTGEHSAPSNGKEK